MLQPELYYHRNNKITNSLKLEIHFEVYCTLTCQKLKNKTKTFKDKSIMTKISRIR